MEPIITPEMLASTGIDIPDEQVVPMLDYFNDILDERVGESVVDALDDQQIEVLSQLQETASEEAIHNWIKANVKDLDEIIQGEVDIILGDAAELRDAFSTK